MIAETNPLPEKRFNDAWLDKPLTRWWSSFTVEKLLIVLIIVLALVTRFYNLGARTMSHDEINHVVPSYTIENYVYDPVTHGPFQFHALALSYFLFGDSDFSARVPAATFGIAVVLFTLFAWRRYLGRLGSLIAALLFTISPYILFYSRYTRNEIFIVFWGLVMLWLFLRYLEEGKTKWLLWLTFITAMHYADKATSFIFSAEALIFLALLFLVEMNHGRWKTDRAAFQFRLLTLATILALVLTMGVYALTKTPAVAATPLEPTQATVTAGMVINSKLPLLAAAGLALALAVSVILTLIRGLGWEQIRHSRSFDLVVLQLVLILPLLTALPIRILGFDPQDYSQAGIMRSGAVFVILLLLSLFLGLLWNKKVFPKSMAIFWSIFIILYTTFFTHGEGFFKGLVGALGYWLSQQAVERGTQPLYYYALVQIPIYEFLPALGTLLALVIGASRHLFTASVDHPFVSPFKTSQRPVLEENAKVETMLSRPEDALAPAPAPEPSSWDADLDLDPDASTPQAMDEAVPAPYIPWLARIFRDPPEDTGKAASLPTLVLLLFWSLISLLAFSLAGERMPWLTTHITMPMILCTGWAVGYVVESVNWASLRRQKAFLTLILAFVLLISMSKLAGSLLGNNPPFQGKDLVHLQGTSTFLLATVGVLASGVSLFFVFKQWTRDLSRLVLLTAFAIMAVFTFRAAYRAAYINYDNAKEFLVYAHSTRDMKDVLEQVETISKRLYGDKSIKFAYDRNVRYPFWWYGRDFPNRYDFDANITKSLKDYPIILVGAELTDKIKPVVGEDYYAFDYKRMWWPNEDIYRNWSISKVLADLKDPAKRAGLWQLWFNRDYTQYALAYNNPSLTLATWSPSDTMKMYIRKDIAAQVWEFGLSPTPVEPKTDPYAANTITLDPGRVISVAGESTFAAPRDVAVAPDGSLYAADSRNHRIVHLDSTGLFLNAWGSYANAAEGLAPEGTFNEPWGVAVGPDGNVYVADTWNHRIQVFTADGQFVRMWSSFVVDGLVDVFWGPRGIAVDGQGRVFVTDTGKQRVVVFDSQGNYLSQFGGIGMEVGKLDEPVGIEVSAEGLVYVADTWNNRVQVFMADGGGVNYFSVASWDVDAWTSDSLDNKPFLALAQDGDVYITDPDAGRIIRFDSTGVFKQLWGGYDNTYMMGIISGIATTAEGNVWVSDALSNTLLEFTPPEVP